MATRLCRVFNPDGALLSPGTRWRFAAGGRRACCPAAGPSQHQRSRLANPLGAHGALRARPRRPQPLPRAAWRQPGTAGRLPRRARHRGQLRAAGRPWLALTAQKITHNATSRRPEGSERACRKSRGHCPPIAHDVNRWHPPRGEPFSVVVLVSLAGEQPGRAAGTVSGGGRAAVPVTLPERACRAAWPHRGVGLPARRPGAAAVHPLRRLGRNPASPAPSRAALPSASTYPVTTAAPPRRESARRGLDPIPAKPEGRGHARHGRPGAVPAANLPQIIRHGRPSPAAPTGPLARCGCAHGARTGCTRPVRPGALPGPDQRDRHGAGHTRPSARLATLRDT
jgi:hypothetical protein